MNPHALESSKEGTWARSFFPEAEKPLEKVSKPIIKDQPDNPSVKIIKVEEFPSNSEAPKMRKDRFIPGLFTKKRRTKKAKLLKKGGPTTKVN